MNGFGPGLFLMTASKLSSFSAMPSGSLYVNLLSTGFCSVASRAALVSLESPASENSGVLWTCPVLVKSIIKRIKLLLPGCLLLWAHGLL